jgi:hypothetical protein
MPSSSRRAVTKALAKVHLINDIDFLTLNEVKRGIETPATDDARRWLTGKTSAKIVFSF